MILLPAVLEILKERKRQADSKWIFPSPVNPEVPCSPDAIRKKLKRILEHAECQSLRFHDLRHTFATAALEHGMDVKTLSAIIGHVNSATTLNIYSHVTDQMRKQAAEKIDAGIGACEAPEGDLPRVPSEDEKYSLQNLSSPTKVPAENPAPAACTRSTTTSGKENTPPAARTEKESIKTSTPRPKKNARKSCRP